MNHVVRAKRSLGQNFLVDPNIQRKIVDAVDPGADDVIVEIGPGTGALTRTLAERAGRLVCIELDDALAADLRRAFEGVAHVEVLHRDVLTLELADIAPPASIKVVGNIPYNITSPILFHLLERRGRPRDIVIMVQREVADRILAAPGFAAYGALSVGVQSVAKVERILHVGRGAFRPVPRVDSTALRITPLRPPPLTAGQETDLRSLTRAAFAWRRKQLQKTLRASPLYGLDPAAVQR
ncbi:MAG: 16S rRNA (adenine(1518)-N(6)/adenine(1519)-N(6))-dimethyltransferase RsmA, partial [Longimicrobiales bacterium]